MRFGAKYLTFGLRMTQQTIRRVRMASLVWGALVLFAGLFLGSVTALADDIPGLQGSLSASTFAGEGVG